MKKTCIKCLKELPLEDFYKHKKMKDGHTSICKECAKEKTRQWNMDNKEKKRETGRIYYVENKETIQENSLAWKRKNRDRINFLGRERRNADIEASRIQGQEKMRAWRAANPEKERESRRILEESRPGEKARKLQEWRKKNPEKSREHVNKRRALRRGAKVATLTAAQWNLIKRSYDYRCAYCGRKMKRLTQDHVVPLSKGGEHTAANIVPACQSCNSKKHNGAPLCPVQIILPLAV